MLSRLLGLVREQVFAVTLGAGAYSDAFLAAFRIPNLLRDLFAEGALSTAFVPTYVATLRQKSRAAAFALANRVMSTLTIYLGLVALVAMVFPDPVVRLVATGFSPEKAALCATLVRIMMPFLPAISLAVVAMGALNAEEKYTAPGLASSMFNLVAIAGGVAVWVVGAVGARGGDDLGGAHAGGRRRAAGDPGAAAVQDGVSPAPAPRPSAARSGDAADRGADGAGDAGGRGGADQRRGELVVRQPDLRRRAVVAVVRVPPDAAADRRVRRGGRHDRADASVARRRRAGLGQHALDLAARPADGAVPDRAVDGGAGAAGRADHPPHLRARAVLAARDARDGARAVGLRDRAGRVRGDQGRGAGVLRAGAHAGAVDRQRVGGRLEPDLEHPDVPPVRSRRAGGRDVDRRAGERGRAHLCVREEDPRFRVTRAARPVREDPRRRGRDGGGGLGDDVAPRAAARAGHGGQRDQGAGADRGGRRRLLHRRARAAHAGSRGAAQALPLHWDDRSAAVSARAACDRAGRGSTASASRSGSSTRGSCRRTRRPRPARRTC